MKKFKEWLADKPKFLQWILGTNLGRIAVAAFFCLIFVILADSIASDFWNPVFNTCATVFAGIMGVHILFFTITGIIGAIKDGKHN